MDQLYSLYSGSPKARRKIDACAAQLGTEVLKIGKNCWMSVPLVTIQFSHSQGSVAVVRQPSFSFHARFSWHYKRGSCTVGLWWVTQEAHERRVLEKLSSHAWRSGRIKWSIRGSSESR